QQRYGIPALPQYNGGQLAGTLPATAPKDNGVVGSAPLPGITGDGTPVVQNSGQPTRSVIDPVLQLRGQIIGKMIANGVPDQKIKDYVQQNGIDGTNIDQILQFRNTKDFQDWKRQNPGTAYPLGPSFYTNQVPMSAARQTFNEAASTGVGGAAAAFPVAAGNALTGDRAGSLMGPQAQIAMQLMRSNHPVSSVLGDAAGQALAQELVPGSGILPTIGKDLLYGAYSGSGDNGPGA